MKFTPKKLYKQVDGSFLITSTGGQFVERTSTSREAAEIAEAFASDYDRNRERLIAAAKQAGTVLDAKLAEIMWCGPWDENR